MAEFIIQHHMRAPRLEKATKILDLMLLVRRYRQDISLEDSFVQYKKGMELLKVCNEKIDAIEKKVLILNGEGETDEF